MINWKALRENVRGHVTRDTLIFEKKIKGSCPDCPWEQNCNAAFPSRLFVMKL